MMFVIGYYYSFVIIINCIIVNYLRIAPSGEVIKILYCIVIISHKSKLLKLRTCFELSDLSINRTIKFHANL